MLENHASELIMPISEYDCSRSLLALDMWLKESSEILLSDHLNIQSGDIISLLGKVRDFINKTEHILNAQV